MANLDVKTFRFAGRLPKPHSVDVVEIKVSELGRKQLFPAPEYFTSYFMMIVYLIELYLHVDCGIICFAISGTYQNCQSFCRPAHAINGIYLSDKARSVRNTKIVSKVKALE